MSRRVACLFSEVFDLFGGASLPGRGSYLALSCRGVSSTGRQAPEGSQRAAALPDVELMVGKPDSAKDFFTRLLYLSTSQPQLKEGLT